MTAPAATPRLCQRCQENPKAQGRGQRYCAECKERPHPCPKCGEVREVRLKPGRKGVDYPFWYCPPCDSRARLEKYHDDPDAYNVRRNARKYGIPLEAAEALWTRRAGACDVCDLPPRGKGPESVLHVDHDHAAGKVRGLLCGPCNKALGLVGDDPAILRALASYLQDIPNTPFN